MDWTQTYKDILEQSHILDIHHSEEKMELFNLQWGIKREVHPNNNINNDDTNNDNIELNIPDITQKSIINDIHYSDNVSKQLINQFKNITDHHKGLSIINVFILDLLGRDTLAAKIFQHKFELEFEKADPISHLFKSIVLLLLLVFNGFFVYYIILKAYTKGYNWQIRYLWSYVFQMLTEIFLYETIGMIIFIILI